MWYDKIVCIAKFTAFLFNSSLYRLPRSNTSTRRLLRRPFLFFLFLLWFWLRFIFTIYSQDCEISNGGVEVEDALGDVDIFLMNCEPKGHDQIMLIFFVPFVAGSDFLEARYDIFGVSCEDGPQMISLYVIGRYPIKIK